MSLPNVNEIRGQRPIGQFFAHRFSLKDMNSHAFFSLIFLTDSYLNYMAFS